MEKTLDSPLSARNHQKFHSSPTEEGEVTPAKAYLSLPFRQTYLLTAIIAAGNSRFNQEHPYFISEGFTYSQAEQREHHHKVHGAIDFVVPYGTPVVAPCDGYTMASFHTTKLTHEKQPLFKEGEQMWWGLGFFVQILVPGPFPRHVRFAHLSNVAENIPFSLPKPDEDGGWIPTNHNLHNVEFIHHPMVVEIKRGDTLGFVGNSGMGLGWNGYIETTERPIPVDPTKYKSYDEVHLHFEEGRRQNNGRGAFQSQRDPYDIYLTASRYPTPTRSRPMGPEPLWILENGLPKFAD